MAKQFTSMETTLKLLPADFQTKMKTVWVVSWPSSAADDVTPVLLAALFLLANLVALYRFVQIAAKHFNWFIATLTVLQNNFLAFRAL
jgi:DNA-binding ferritin-like protein (Dps family)